MDEELALARRHANGDVLERTPEARHHVSLEVREHEEPVVIGKMGTHQVFRQVRSTCNRQRKRSVLVHDLEIGDSREPMIGGDLATADPALIKYKLGKNGLMLRQFANGEDVSPVMPDGFEPPIKSVGHGTTCVRDLTCPAEVWQVIYEMAQDVGHRLRRHGCAARGVEISVRDSALGWYQWQMPLAAHTQSPYELAQLAYALFREHYLWQLPVRALTVTAVRLTDEDAPAQTDMFLDHVRREKRRALEDAVDALRGRFGERSVVAASLLGELPVARDRCETVPMPAPMYR